MPLYEQVNVLAWGMVAFTTMISVFSLKCRSALECCVMAAISACAFAKTWLYAREEIPADASAVALGIALAIYFILKADASWAKKS